jgi:hypothetical protein
MQPTVWYKLTEKRKAAAACVEALLWVAVIGFIVATVVLEWRF